MHIVDQPTAQRKLDGGRRVSEERKEVLTENVLMKLEMNVDVEVDYIDSERSKKDAFKVFLQLK